MVIGSRATSRRGPTVQVDYQIHLEEIKPWPPSQNLKNIRSVLIQWENGDRSSGSTSSVVPSLSDSRIGFDEFFRLPVTLLKDMSMKGGDVFHKNLLEFNLYEPRRDKTVKGQLLGTAVFDLADFGVLREIRSVAIPLNCTRSFRNTSQSVLHLRVQPVEKGRLSSSSKVALQKQASNGGDSVSPLLSEEYSEEAELASLTDDDVSSHSSLTAESIASVTALSSTDGSIAARENGSGKGRHSQTSKVSNAKPTRSEIPSYENQKGSSSDSSSVDLSALHATPSNEPCSSSTISIPVLETNSGSFDSHAQSSASSIADENMPTPANGMHTGANVNITNGTEPQTNDGYEDLEEIVNAYDIHGEENKDGRNDEEFEESGKMVGDREHHVGDESSLGRARLKHARSIRSSADTIRSNGSVSGSSVSIERKDAKIYPSERRNGASDGKILELENRIKMLEGELRETAAIEASLYSVVAEHGSSVNKVHAPARRLSRMYIQAVKGNYQSRRANVAQAAASGLVVVAKTCGNDVPRLTFWLSNCVVLRTIITETLVQQQLPVSDVPFTNNNAGKRLDQRSPKLTWKASASRKKFTSSSRESVDDWEDPWTFASALEKVESWIFSRIIESVWWQTLTPHMQSSAAKVVDKLIDSESKRTFRRASNSGGQEQVNLSLELWKKAFKDACERLCPVRAGGHECGCLPVLAKLIMEQCVARLDVAMFNAVLRESIDDIPTDPVSDPISEAKVLPILAGKSSFGAGAQLKNAIGNWSRLLTDLFGMDDDDDDPLEDENSHSSDVDDDDKSRKPVSSFKSFHLLKSLSDLMMLPKDMLLSSSIRKEVCPTFSAHLIRMVLENFVPDEFCPDPIPNSVMEALEAEEPADDAEGTITCLPCTAPSVAYAPPHGTSVAAITADVGSQSQLRRSLSMLRKSNTSDDELDELESPLSRIIDNMQASTARARPSLNLTETGSANAVRYRLLREVWMNSE